MEEARRLLCETSDSNHGTQREFALATGASSGIGAAKVSLAARRMDRLQALVAEIKAAGGEVIALQMDVTDQAAFAEGVVSGCGTGASFLREGRSTEDSGSQGPMNSLRP